MLGLAVVLALAFAAAFFFAFLALLSARSKAPELARAQFEEWRAREAAAARTQLDQWRKQESDSARAQLEKWRRNELEAVRVQQLDVARREALSSFESWKVEHETSIRRDAITRSQAVIAGKVTEHLVPYMGTFPYNPKDARFIGSPIDILVFDGADEGTMREVVFLEVKTGRSQLNAKQKQIRDAVLAGRVVWRELKLDGIGG